MINYDNCLTLYSELVVGYSGYFVIMYNTIMSSRVSIEVIFRYYCATCVRMIYSYEIIQFDELLCVNVHLFFLNSRVPLSSVRA